MDCYELQNSILRIFCQKATSTQKLIDYPKELAKSSRRDTKNAKAILLLKEIVRYLPSL